MKARSRPPYAPPSTSTIRRVIAGAGALLALSLNGCLDRPVSPLEPETTDVFIDSVKQSTVNRIDLLFMIDNSSSMADKQQILRDAVPDLLNRLVNPVCVVKNEQGTIVQTLDPPPDPDAPCPVGKREFRAVKDIHVGVITSSLGGVGADHCSPGHSHWNATQNDGGHLITRGSGGTAVGTYQGAGFLAWDPGQERTPPGERSALALTSTFQELVVGAGENGCGFEASLEAWYRFLIDPEPYAELVRVPCSEGAATNDCVAPSGIDQVLLEQRRAFLRPDSLLAIIMLTDENDCSIRAGGQSFLAAYSGNGFLLPRSTGICKTSPNDPCCHSCNQPAPNGCPDTSLDPECQKGGYDAVEDNINLRCFDQKKRFGIDFLYPTSRYIDGLRQLRVQNRAGELVPNPLYEGSADGLAPRDPSNVFLAGIVGVPWQAIENREASTPEDLVYLTADEMEQYNTWPNLLGDPDTGREASDPLMRESVDPRPGIDETYANGGEWNIADRGDLQYACTFPLATPRDCTAPGASSSCDCAGPQSKLDTERKPLCRDPQTGTFTNIQRRAKAFPGSRHLEVLKGFGENSIVASICARNVDQVARRDFGYRPAMNAIVDRLKGAIVDRCLPRELAVDPTGDVPCAVVETYRGDGGTACSCAGTARKPPRAEVGPAVRKRLEEQGQCGGDTGVPCSDFCLCEITRAGTDASGATVDADAHRACLTEEAPAAATVNGWCYVDPSSTESNPALIADCEATSPRKLRFVNAGEPRPGASAYIACLGKPALE